MSKKQNPSYEQEKTTQITDALKRMFAGTLGRYCSNIHAISGDVP